MYLELKESEQQKGTKDLMDMKNRASSSKPTEQPKQRKNKKENRTEVPPSLSPSSSNEDEAKNRRKTYFSSAVLTKGSTKVSPLVC